MTGDNDLMNAGPDYWRRLAGKPWAAPLRRAAAAPHAPVLGCLVLGILALLQAYLQRPEGAPYPIPGGPVPGAAVPAAVTILLAAATTLPLGFLWSQPRAAAVIIAAASLISAVLTDALTVAGAVALLVALGRLGHRGPQLLAAGLCAAFAVLALARSSGHHAALVPVLLAACTPLAAWAGYARRARSEQVARSAESEAIAGTLLEHTARGERARISRELHDVVAHHISMIAVQAETARLTTAGMPAAGAQRLSAIGDTARSALTEMRRLLGVLREDTGADRPQRRPQPGLAQLNELLDEARDAAGSGARLIVSGWQRPLDPGVELAAYRIIQEALTNSRRHAPGAAVDVELRYDASELYLRVRDNGPGPAAGSGPPGGHGLLGMRERATAAGGTLRAGRAPGGGFLIEASLPATAEESAA